jgi:hypothetical protein
LNRTSVFALRLEPLFIIGLWLVGCYVVVKEDTLKKLMYKNQTSVSYPTVRPTAKIGLLVNLIQIL